MKRAGFILLSVSVRALRSTVLVRKPFCAMNPKDPLCWTSPTSTPSCCRVGRALSKLWRASSADTPTMMLPLHTCIVILQFLDSFQLQFLHSFFVIITVLVSVKKFTLFRYHFRCQFKNSMLCRSKSPLAWGGGTLWWPHCRTGCAAVWPPQCASRPMQVVTCRPSRSEDAADIRS